MEKSNELLTENILFHTLSVEESLDRLNTSVNGIDEDEWRKRLEKFGKNELKEGKKRTIAEMFLDQFKEVMVIILIIAALISGFMGELTDTVIILFVVVLNDVLGVIQESKAEKALAALKELSKPYSKVKRAGEVKQIKSEEIVPGDIVLIEAGDYVPADMRLIESASLRIEEAALTGESVPVEKSVGVIEKPDLVIGDRINMGFMGSVVTYGRGMGVVTGTGMNTEVGKIAGYLSEHEEEDTPLQKKLAEMGKYLSVAVIIISIIIFLTGVLRGKPIADMFLTAISLAVAAIPEGLPAIVTIVLAIGVQKMSKNNAIIRKLPAVETLGGTEIICSDKTGTLTQNKMTVKELYLGNKFFDADDIKPDEKDLGVFLQVIALCNDSKVVRVSGDKINTIGDPTETALVDFAAKKGFYKDEMDRYLPREAEIPFDSERKLMTTVISLNGRFRILTKGAPDILINRCEKALIGSEIVSMDAGIMENVREANKNMASRALRVLAVAFKDVDEIPENLDPASVEKGLTFSGLVGMIDPPRIEVKDAVRTCKTAGIRPVMITGDHRDTAAAIARELEIITSDDEVITGAELDKISDEDFISDVNKYSVYARVSPEHKVRIVKAWKDNGKTVAMTGDGVNDAPALKISDIGIGMGITGTDVAKGVSDMVLADDNFATIVLAVKEGRRIFSNIRKAIQFLLSANMGEILTLFVATMLNWDILFPIHILWINLVTDALPALALGVEKPEKDIMQQHPRKASSSVFSEGMGFNIIYQGILEALITLGVFFYAAHVYPADTAGRHPVAITMAFLTLGLIQLAHCFNVRSRTKSIFKIGWFTNKYVIAAVATSALLQVIVVLVPAFNGIFRVVSLNLEQWLVVIIASIVIIPLVEIVKFVQNKLARCCTK